MILEAETILLEAVRLRLVETLGLKHDQIDIEIDDLTPAMIGNTYYCLSPASGQPGKHNGNTDQVFHYQFGVRVAIIERITDTPRDRRRSVFMDLLRSINAKLSEVSRKLRFDYETINIANRTLEAEQISGKFHRPLIPLSMDQKPRIVTSDVIGAKRATTTGDPTVALIRGINFGQAEFIGRE